MIHARRAETHRHTVALNRATAPHCTHGRRGDGAPDPSITHSQAGAHAVRPTSRLPTKSRARSQHAQTAHTDSPYHRSTSAVRRLCIERRSLARPRPLPPRGSSREAEHTHTHKHT